MAEGAIFRKVSVVYNATWLVDNPDLPHIERKDVDLDELQRVFEEGLVAFVDAEEGIGITVIEDAERTISYDIMIDGKLPADETSDQELEFNTEKAVERFFQLGSYWNTYHDRLG